MFRIVTDTSANLPTAYLQQEHITIIPFTFHADGDEQACLDLNTFDAKTFYAQMRSGTKVSTSQIPPQRYLDVLTPMLEAGEDVLFVSMSSGISGSYASGQIAARQLREEFPARKLLLVDTYSASLGEGLLVMRAVDCRRDGMSIDDTYTLLRSLRTAWRRSSRSTTCATSAGPAACPILKPPSGPCCRSSPCSRATRRARSSASPSSAAASAPSRPSPSAMKNWSATRRRRRSASRMPTAHPTRRSSPRCCCRSSCPPKQILLVDYEPVTGSHVGPGALALFFLSDDKVRMI